MNLANTTQLESCESLIRLLNLSIVQLMYRSLCKERSAFTDKEFTGDAVIVMYIGHGEEEHVLIKYGANKVDLDDDIIKFLPEDLKEEVINARTKCKEHVFLFGMSPMDDEHYNKNIGAAYIICSSSEGYEAYYYEFVKGISTTIFGRVFMQCLAQHACTLNLQQLFNKTYADMATISVIEQRPVMRQFNVTKDLYFNPGLPENVDN
ncbi:unnamed protein product [Oppiella nova]|uniref:Peptidase C14 caspase domain-containing protein n=1 Tax=Oppiella nova TaxID=334625 RepID=A0A7R9M792_9ACAR|nr:unnamed protein product [Oppiella nova]CAG2170892.1 unnamed protein product [Oppiella nova]